MKKRIISIFLVFFITFNLSYAVYDNYKLSKNKVYASEVGMTADLIKKIIVLLMMGGVAVQNNQGVYNDAPQRFYDKLLEPIKTQSTFINLCKDMGKFYLTQGLKDLVNQFKSDVTENPTYTSTADVAITNGIVQWGVYPDSPTSCTGRTYQNIILSTDGNVYLNASTNRYYLNGTGSKYMFSNEYTYGIHYLLQNGSWVQVNPSTSPCINFVSIIATTANIMTDYTMSATAFPTDMTAEDVLHSVDYQPVIDNTKSIDDYKTGLTFTISQDFTYDDVTGKTTEQAINQVTTNDDVIGSTDTTTEVGVLTRIWDRIISIPDVIGGVMDGVQTKMGDIAGVIEGGITGVIDGVKAIPTTIGDVFSIPDDLDTTINTDPLQMNANLVFTKFPFSIPWDLKNAVSSLSTAGVAPKWTLTFPSAYFHGGGSVEIDFSMFNAWASIIRWGVLMAFIIGLIIETNKLIGRN